MIPYRKRLDQPVHEQSDPDPAHVLSNLVQRAEVDLHEHRNDHDPDQQADREVDPRHLHASDRLKYPGQNLARGDAHDDAEEDPHGQVALEDGQRGEGMRSWSSSHS